MHKVKSCSDIFARRGDPWITERDQGRDGRKPVAKKYPDEPLLLQRREFSGDWGKLLGKNGSAAVKKDVQVFTPDLDENPDLDRYLFAGKAQPKSKGALISVSKPRTHKAKADSSMNKLYKKLAAIKAKNKVTVV